MEFLLEHDPLPEQPVKLTLRIDQYSGCKLPTLYANDVPVLHFLNDGRIVIRDEETTNLPHLHKMGFAISSTLVYNPRESKRIGILETIPASNLPCTFPIHE